MTGDHWCQKCGSYTRWVEVRAKVDRSYVSEKCAECGRRFPCLSKCEHLDCQERRDEDSPKSLFQRIHEVGLDKPKKLG